jgi:hypothetical protein
MNPIILEAYGDTISARLRAQNMTHFPVVKRGQHLVIYAADPGGDKENRARFTWRHGQTFALGIADPGSGRWSATGETGTVDALLTVLIEQFGFILADW